MEIDFPFHVDKQTANVACASYARHVRQMVEQLLFTTPGERVNRPQFGCGVLDLVFAPDDGETATVNSALIQASIERWLGTRIKLITLDLQAEDAGLTITIEYILLYTGHRAREVFRR